MEKSDVKIMENNKNIDLKSEMRQAYEKLGKAYYEGGFEDPLPQLLPLFDQITRLKKDNQRKKTKEIVCSKCGMKMDGDSVFCGNCGCRLM